MQYFFSIKMPYIDFLPYYQGKIQTFVVTTTSGVKVQFPAMHLRPYLTSVGLHGYFCMNTENNKFLYLVKVQ